MVILAIEGSGGSELTYQLTKQMISIGAASQNDVVIRAPGVAPRHLVIQRNNGVFPFLGQNRQVVVLNGERRSRGVLRVGDRIRIGTATLIFKGIGEDEVEVEVASQDAVKERPAAPAAPVATQPASRPRSEVVLYSEPTRLSEARNHMVEIFRAEVQSDLVPPLRTFLATFCAKRQAMLARLDQEGRFQPIASQWTGEIPRLPARTFEELGSGGRFAVLHLGTRTLLIYPVECGDLQSNAYLVAETNREDQEEDQILLAELARMLAIHWDRVERSSNLYESWETTARKRVEEDLAGTSHAIRVLRDSVLEAARSPFPALFCGRPGSGRVSTAMLVASLHSSGPLTVQLFPDSSRDDAALRVELFGAPGESTGSLIERAKGGVLVIRDLELLPQNLQREMAAIIRHDLESVYGPSVRWMATTVEDCMGQVSEGTIDSKLFNIFQRHVIRVPALDDRREDLPLLIVRLLDTVGAEQGKEIRGIELETLNSLINHPFEGQMTELVGELRRLVSATPDGEMVRGLVPISSGGGGDGSRDEPEAAAATLLSQDDLKIVVPAVERLIIDRVLRRTLGNQSKAARVLNLSRGALIAKMKEYDVPDYRYLRRGR